MLYGTSVRRNDDAMEVLAGNIDITGIFNKLYQCRNNGIILVFLLALCMYIANNTMVSFEHIEYLYGLLVIVPLVVLFIVLLRYKKTIMQKLGDTALIQRLTAGVNKNAFRTKFILALVAIVFFIVAASNPRMPQNNGKEESAGIDIMIALDVSKSMLANDIKPNRLERAKQLVGNLIQSLPGNRIGVVLFAGKAYLQMPLTADINEANIYLANASTEAVPVQGTNISEALTVCDNGLDTKEKAHKAVVLISDGEDHDANAVATAKTLADNGVEVYTVGIGSADGSPIIDPVTGTYKTDKDGKTVISKLNEQILHDVSSATGGDYYHLDDVQQTEEKLATALNNMEKKLIEGSGGKMYFSFAPILIALGLVLGVIELFIPETKKRAILQ